jgi:glycerophosphoryl diester phosphodiesterase
MPIQIIAHRGNSSECPENTLTAFASALELGVPAIELDVHLTRDGAVVVIHDESIERTTDGRGRVADMTLQELRRVSAGQPAVFGAAFAHERVPTLAEVIDLVRGRAHLLVELKGRADGRSDDRVERATVETLRQTGMRDVALLSFDRAALEVCRALAPEIPRGLLAHQPPTAPLLAAARELGCRLVLPEKGLLCRDLVAEARGAGLDVATWIVDDPQELDDLEDLGLAGVGSNRPRALLAHLATRRP